MTRTTPEPAPLCKLPHLTSRRAFGPRQIYRPPGTMYTAILSRIKSPQGTSSSGVTGFTTLRYPSDLISLQAFPSPSASTFRFSASFPRRQARELSMRSFRSSVWFLFLMDS
ncbi:hypothetical protein AVEN_94944-1 [Araneus ventricosus]|uniref:Uncharacterized protein n=1 Tax=Araneus ventricosus TaxID=182803 RepID=A0A4Y2DJW1_ARAVE|nr:hypothetical protein AVEN_94944-1 [Araneus ventricosus]